MHPIENPVVEYKAYLRIASLESKYKRDKNLVK
jgi:hypothetical protein